MAGSFSAGRQRSCATIVITRTDSLAGPPAASAPRPVPPQPPGDRQWLGWIPLVLCLVALWSLFLLGDSLRAP